VEDRHDVVACSLPTFVLIARDREEETVRQPLLRDQRREPLREPLPGHPDAAMVPVVDLIGDVERKIGKTVGREIFLEFRRIHDVRATFRILDDVPETEKRYVLSRVELVGSRFHPEEAVTRVVLGVNAPASPVLLEKVPDVFTR
jgi:hypothetical protein